MARSVEAMDSQRSLALDLFLAGALDRATVTQLVADHAVGPARRAWSLPAPRQGETPSDVIMQPVRGGYGPGWVGPVPELVVSTVLFDPVVAGYVLFRSLFPHAFVSPEPIEHDLAAPNWIYFEHSRQLAVFRYEDVECLVAGAFGDEVEPIGNDDLEGPYRARENRAALQDLAEAQAMVRRVLDVPRPADLPLFVRRQTGLRHVDESAAWPLDEVLRHDVHQRAVWFARVDILIPLGEVVTDIDGTARLGAPDDSDPILDQVDDHGVYPTQIPETIRGAVALDLVRTFPGQRDIAACSHCARPVVLTPHQVGRVDAGQPVYHPDCTGPARRRWMRDYQRRRRAGAPA